VIRTAGAVVSPFNQVKSCYIISYSYSKANPLSIHQASAKLPLILFLQARLPIPVKLKLLNSWRGIPTGNLWVSSSTRTTDYL